MQSFERQIGAAQFPISADNHHQGKYERQKIRQREGIQQSVQPEKPGQNHGQGYAENHLTGQGDHRRGQRLAHGLEIDKRALVQHGQENQAQIEHFLKSKDFSDALKTTMPKLFSVVGQTANIIISIVASMITLLYMFFILLDYETLTANWIRIFPKKSRPFWHELMKDVEREMNNYIRGQGMVALCMGIMFCIGFTIIGFPMAIGLGILIGIMDLVPYLHTFAPVSYTHLRSRQQIRARTSGWSSD